MFVKQNKQKKNRFELGGKDSYLSAQWQICSRVSTTHRLDLDHTEYHISNSNNNLFNYSLGSTSTSTLSLRLKTDRKNPVPTRSVFYFIPPVFVFVGSRFRIYRNGRGVFLPVSAGYRFHPELTCIYSVFHPFSIYMRYVEIDMLINLLITNYAC